MQRTGLQAIYFRIYVSKLFSSLQSLNELYSQKDHDEYLRIMEIFYTDLLRFPRIYNKNANNFQSNNELITSSSTTSIDPLNSIYYNNTELLLKIDQFIRDKSTTELNGLSDRIRLFLDQVYDSIHYKKGGSKRRKKFVLIAGIAVFLIVAAIAYSPLKARYFEEKEKYIQLANEELYKEITLKDILNLKEALQKYYADNKSFPKSSGGWDAILASFGESKETWIEGLIPKYIKRLPVDPRKSKDPGKQYMYRSDGTDFKLIAHYAMGMTEVIENHPELVDPIRPSWAFGIWSEGAKSW